jgi:hypothetical protein
MTIPVWLASAKYWLATQPGLAHTHAVHHAIWKGPETMSAPEPPKRRGCFFYGCITCIGVFLLMALLGFLAVRKAINWVNGQIAQYTEAAPMALPRDRLPAEELKQLRERVDAFSAALNAGTNVVDLALTGPELNALIAQSTNDAQINLADKVHVSIDRDQIRGQVSLPIEQFFRFPFIKTKGRYFNGQGTFTLSFTNGILDVRAQDLQMKGAPVPEDFMAKMRAQNLADGYNSNPTNAAQLNRFESIDVNDGRLIIHPRKPGQ